MTLATTTIELDSPLSAQLREATQQAHSEAEGSQFMSRLIAGELNPEAVAFFTGQLWFIYEALERAVRNVDCPVADPRLERKLALEADLAEMYGADWRDQVRILPATARYVAHLGELDSPHLVTAHHYVRYLGDISGGQVIAARLGAVYGIDRDALNFYHFTAIDKIPPYRKAYKAALNEMQLSDAARAELLEEARVAFGLNSAVFAEMDVEFPAG